MLIRDEADIVNQSAKTIDCFRYLTVESEGLTSVSAFLKHADNYTAGLHAD